MLWVPWIVEQEYRLVSWSTFTTGDGVISTMLQFEVLYLEKYSELDGQGRAGRETARRHKSE